MFFNINVSSNIFSGGESFKDPHPLLGTQADLGTNFYEASLAWCAGPVLDISDISVRLGALADMRRHIPKNQQLLLLLFLNVGP